jgi:hypothetical protein
MALFKMLVWSIFVALPSYAQNAAESAASAAGQPSAAAAGSPVILKVRRMGRSTPLSRVEVTYGEQLLYTDAGGEVVLQLKPGENATLMLKKAGYETRYVTTGDLLQQKLHEVFLYPGAPDDNEVIIQGKRRPEVSKKTVSVRETQRVAPSGDPVQIAKLMPGVASQNFRNEVIIRGSGPQDSRYFVDDIEVPLIFHQIGNFSIVPDSLLSEVEFSSGGFGVEYGNATGGIISLKSSSEVPEEARSEYRINVPFFVTATHERPLGEKSSLYLSLRHSTSELIIPPLIPDDAEVTLVPYFGDAHLRYLKLENDGFYKVTTMASDDGLVLGAPIGESDREDGRVSFNYRNRFVVLAVERQKRLTSDLKIKSTPQVSYADANIDISFKDMFLKYDMVGMTMPTELSYRHGPNLYFYLGVQPSHSFSRFDVKFIAPPAGNDPFYDIEDAPLYTTRRNYKLNSYAAWTALDVGFGPLVLTPGIRYFSGSLVTAGGYDPRLQARYKLTENDMIKAAFGRYSIDPQPAEVSEDFGNPDLGYEVSEHNIIGWEHTFSDRWLMDLQFFYKNSHHLVESDPLRRYLNTGRRISQGAELFLRRNLTEKFMGWLSYTYSTVKERKNSGSRWHTSPYDQTHILNLTGSYRLNAKWDLGTRMKYVSGDVYTPVTSGKYHAGYDKYLPVYDTERPYSARFPESHLVDLFATYDAYYETYKLSYRFGVQMIRFTKPKNSVDYTFDYSEAKLSSMDLPPLPFVEVKGEF